MPFLTVLGNGSWAGSAEPKEGGGYKMHTYRSGVHEVDEATAERARKARAKGVKMLVVTDYEPEITTSAERVTEGGGLTAEDLKKPGLTGGGVQIKRKDGGVVIEPETGKETLAMEFPCERCERSFPTAAALLWHDELHHEVTIEAEVLPLPEPVGEPELQGTGDGSR